MTTSPHGRRPSYDCKARVQHGFEALRCAIELQQADAKGSIKKRLRYRLKSVQTVLDYLGTIESLHAHEVDALRNVEGIGERSVARVRELIDTDRLSELHQPPTVPPPTTSASLPSAPPPSAEDRARLLRELRRLGTVVGIGERTARRLYDDGITLDTLLRGPAQSVPDYLTATQRLGVLHYDDLQTRIPRDEIRNWEQLLLSHLGRSHPSLRGVVCGSYRRGLATSGDVDVLFTSDAWGAPADALAGLRALLADSFFQQTLVAHMTNPLRVRSKYMGFARLHGGGRVRRIDVRAVPKDSFVAALLYFTGDAAENLRLRNRARALGMTLNEYGLVASSTTADGGRGDALPLRDEEHAYSLLGIPYLAPTQRITAS